MYAKNDESGGYILAKKYRISKSIGSGAYCKVREAFLVPDKIVSPHHPDAAEKEEIHHDKEGPVSLLTSVTPPQGYAVRVFHMYACEHSRAPLFAKDGEVSLISVMEKKKKKKKKKSTLR
eukprot:Trichotokara_eunicae@DN588_c0_g1_i2.p1